MSNQVYSNSQHKYFAQPGMTRWQLTGSQTVTEAEGSKLIAWQSLPDINQGSGSAITSNAGVFTVNEEGLYSITLAAALTMPTAAWDYRITLNLAAGNLQATNVPLARVKAYTPFNGAIGSLIEQLSAVAYIPQGGAFVVFLENFTATEALTINASGVTLQSVLQVTKIA